MRNSAKRRNDGERTAPSFRTPNLQHSALPPNSEIRTPNQFRTPNAAFRILKSSPRGGGFAAAEIRYDRTDFLHRVGDLLVRGEAAEAEAD